MASRFSFPAGRIARVPIRVHFLLPAYAAFMVLRTPGYARSEILLPVLVFFAVMFATTLLHELGHALVGRRHGQEGQEILIWPLGGLTFQTGSTGRNARIQVALAGVAVDLLLAFGAGAAMYVRDGIPPGFPRLGWGTDVLALVWALNLWLAALNLLPGLPLDGGAALEPLLWRRWGRTRARLAMLASGAVLGAGILLWGLAGEMPLIAVFGGWCLFEVGRMYRELRQQGVEDPVLFGVHDFSNGYTSLEESRPPPDRGELLRRKAEEKAWLAAERARLSSERTASVALRDREDAQGRLDRLLDRIAAEGISSLSVEERAFLNEESRRLRGKRPR